MIIVGVYALKGKINYRLGDKIEAIRNYDNAIEEQLKYLSVCGESGELASPEYYFHRGNIKKELGDLKGACSDWAKAAKGNQSPFSREAAEFLREHCG